MGLTVQMMRVLAGLMALMISGCATPESLPQSQPDRIGEFQGQYRDFASCMQLSAPDKMIVRADYDSETSKAHLAVFPPRHYAVQDHEITVRQIETEKVLVELRTWPEVDSGQTRDHVTFLARVCEVPA